MKLMIEGHHSPIEVSQMNNSDNQVSILDKNNEVFIWDQYKGRNFKKLDISTDALFSSTTISKDFIILQKEVLDPKHSTVIHVDKNLLSYEPIKIKIQSRNAAGEPLKKSCKNNRYHCLFYMHPVARIRDIQKLVYESAVLEGIPIEKRQGLQVKYNENTPIPVMGLGIIQDPQDPSIQQIDFSFSSNGEYYLYVFLNESLLDGMPITLKVAKGKIQLKEEEEAAREKIAARKAEIDNNKKAEIAHTMKLKEEIHGWEDVQTTHIITTKRADDFLRFYLDVQKEIYSRVKTDVDLLREIKAGGGYDEEKINDLEWIRGDHPRLLHDDLKRPYYNAITKRNFGTLSQEEKRQEVTRKRLIHSTVNHVRDGLEVPRRDVKARLHEFFMKAEMKRDHYGCRVVERYEKHSYFDTSSNVAIAAMRQCSNYAPENSEKKDTPETSPSFKRSQKALLIPSPSSTSRQLTRSTSQPLLILKDRSKSTIQAKIPALSLTPKQSPHQTFPIEEDFTPDQSPKNTATPRERIVRSNVRSRTVAPSANSKSMISPKPVFETPQTKKTKPVAPLKLTKILDRSVSRVFKTNAKTERQDTSTSKINKSSIQLSAKKESPPKKTAQSFRKRQFTKGKTNITHIEQPARSLTPVKIENDINMYRTPGKNNSSRPTTATEYDELESLNTRKNSIFKRSRPSTAQMITSRTEPSETDRSINPPPMVSNATMTSRSPRNSENTDSEKPETKIYQKPKSKTPARLSTVISSPQEEYYSPSQRGNYKKRTSTPADKVEKIMTKDKPKPIGKVSVNLPEKKQPKIGGKKEFTVKTAISLTGVKE